MFRGLDRYQKGVLLFLTTMVLFFTVLYPLTIAREGFVYENVILIPKEEKGSTIYSGKIQGKPARFTVYADKTVKFQYGDKIYGPYTAREDSSAVLKGSGMRGSMTGVELRQGEKIIFRGGVLGVGDYLWLYNEDGSPEDIGISVTTSNGLTTDENGNAIDTMEPSVSVILNLMAGPKLEHKGEWSAWFCGVFICIVTAIFILFADKLFHWHLALRIRNADQAEPSDWEIAERHIAGTVFSVAAMIFFIRGLQ